MAYNFTEEQTDFQKEMGSRIFNLVIGRVLERVHAGFDAKGMENMEKVFLSDDDAAKNEFVKKNIPDFEKIFKEEVKKLDEELKIKIEKQV